MEMYFINSDTKWNDRVKTLRHLCAQHAQHTAVHNIMVNTACLPNSPVKLYLLLAPPVERVNVLRGDVVVPGLDRINPDGAGARTVDDGLVTGIEGRLEKPPPSPSGAIKAYHIIKSSKVN